MADTFVIDHDTCCLEFDPPSLRVPAKAQGSILVRCAAGKRPERLRSVVACSCNRAPPQYMSIRGEVQAPKVYLKETSMPLGVVYVGVPVERELTLINLSNLATKFKFERPGGSSPAFTLAFEPKSGELDAKEVLTIRITYTALTAGVVDEVLGCKVFGCALPLGFRVKGHRPRMRSWPTSYSTRVRSLHQRCAIRRKCNSRQIYNYRSCRRYLHWILVMTSPCSSGGR